MTSLRQYRHIILLRLNDGVQTTRNLSVLYLYKANIPYLSVFNIIERIEDFMKMKLHAELKGLALRLVLKQWHKRTRKYPFGLGDWRLLCIVSGLAHAH